MSKLSVYVIAYNDEPNMRACLESVAGRREESIVVDFPVPIGGIGSIAA